MMYLMANGNGSAGRRVVNYSDLRIDEYRSLAETEYLLSNEANARHLRDSLREARNGGARPRELRAPSSNGPTVFDAGSNYHCHPSLPD